MRRRVTCVHMEENSPVSFFQIQMRDYEEYILASNTSVMHRETGDWDESNYYARVRNVNVNFLYKSMRVIIFVSIVGLIHWIMVK